MKNNSAPKLFFDHGYREALSDVATPEDLNARLDAIDHRIDQAREENDGRAVRRFQAKRRGLVIGARDAGITADFLTDGGR